MKTIQSGIASLVLSIVALSTTIAAAQESGGSDSSSREIRAENCMVKFINLVNIPAEVEGKLTELMFEEGATIEKDEVIAIIDDTQARLALDLKKAEEKEALLNATNDVNLRDAENSEELASAEAEAFKELRREGAIPYWELEKKRLEATRAKLRIDLAKQQMQIAKVQFKAKQSEVAMAEYEIKKRQIKAPFSGYIEARIAQLGEWVQPGSPIAKLVQLDKLRVEGDIDALRYPGQVVRGTPVQVLVYREANSENAVSLAGKVDFVSSEIDLNNRKHIWVEIQNKQSGEDWLIKPGMRAEIIVKQGGQLY